MLQDGFVSRDAAFGEHARESAAAKLVEIMVCGKDGRVGDSHHPSVVDEFVALSAGGEVGRCVGGVEDVDLMWADSDDGAFGCLINRGGRRSVGYGGLGYHIAGVTRPLSRGTEDPLSSRSIAHTILSPQPILGRGCLIKD